MGVSGLAQYLTNHAAYTELQLQRRIPGQPPVLRLVIDGLSLCHFLRSACRKAPVIYYLGVFRTVCNSFLDYLEQFGVEICAIVLDGSFNFPKDDTRFARRSRRVRAMKSLIKSLEKADTSELDSNALLLAAAGDQASMGAYRDTFVATLRSRGVSIVVAEHEADSLTAGLCLKHEGSAVLAEDSDYFVMQAPLLALKSLNWPFENPPEFLTGRLYTPELVQSKLKISPSLYPFLSLLAGNDYTTQNGPLMKAVAKAGGFVNKLGNAVDRVAHLLRWFAKTGNEHVEKQLATLFRAKGLHQEYDRALEKTRQSLQTTDTEELHSPLPSTDPDHVSRIWELHRSAMVPAFVWGILSNHKYWKPILPGHNFSAELQPLLLLMYRAICGKPSPDHLHEPIVITEISKKGSSSTRQLELSTPVIPEISAPPSPTLLLDLIGVPEDDHATFTTLSQKHPSAALCLLAMWYIKKMQLPNCVIFLDTHYSALMAQFCLIQNDTWLTYASQCSTLLPTVAELETSAAFVAVSQVLRTLNVLFGASLGPVDVGDPLFDGVLYALLLQGNAKLKEASECELFDQLNKSWLQLHV